MIESAQSIVKRMLEDDYDQHMRAYRRVKAWDGAHKTYQDIQTLRAKRNDLEKQMGRAISYERALARVGLQKSDVVDRIHGAQIGATNNFKGTIPAKICRDRRCELRSEGGFGGVYRDNTKAKYQPADMEECPGCGQPLEAVDKPIPPSDLRGKFANYIFGVKTGDGSTRWFDEPVAP